MGQFQWLNTPTEMPRSNPFAGGPSRAGPAPQPPLEVQEAGLGALLPLAAAGIARALPWIVGAGRTAAARIGPALTGTAIRRSALYGIPAGLTGYQISEMGEPRYGGDIPPGGPGGPSAGWGFTEDGPPSELVAYSWNTGTAVFYRLINGSIAVRKKNGVWKVFRPAKNIVISKNPKVNDLLRADKKLDRLMSRLAKRASKTRRYKRLAPQSYAGGRGMTVIKQEA